MAIPPLALTHDGLIDALQFPWDNPLPENSVEAALWAEAHCLMLADIASSVPAAYSGQHDGDPVKWVRRLWDGVARQERFLHVTDATIIKARGGRLFFDAEERSFPSACHAGTEVATLSLNLLCMTVSGMATEGEAELFPAPMQTWILGGRKAKLPVFPERLFRVTRAGVTKFFSGHNGKWPFCDSIWAGIEAEIILLQGQETQRQPRSGPTAALVSESKPQWDAENRELRFGNWTKRYAVRGAPARSQWLILSAFQECGWSTRIDDPLPPGKLRDIINNLTDSLGTDCPIRFQRDRTSEGIIWKPVK
jgi:hypothetical protein